MKRIIAFLKLIYLVRYRKTPMHPKKIIYYKHAWRLAKEITE